MRRSQEDGPQRSQQVEDMKEGEGGEPPAKTPEEVEFQPLFNEEQLRRLEQLEQSAPLLIRAEPQIPRPRWMIEEERKAEEWKKEQERMKEMREQQRIAVQMKDDKHVQLMERLIALEKENLEMKKAWQELQVENRQIKEKLKVMLESPRYDTPSGRDTLGRRRVQRRPRSCRRDRRRSRDPQPRRTGEGEKRGFNEMSMELMVKMMDSMQKMMAKKGSPEIEAVRHGQLEVPRLPEWSADSAPLDLGDWLIMLDAVMRDLSPTSHVWWQCIIGSGTRSTRPCPHWSGFLTNLFHLRSCQEPSG